MGEANDPTRVHCYTNPSFCRQSEFIPDDLPPPLQFQGDELPPPPPALLPEETHGGQSNPGFHQPIGDGGERYVYLQERDVGQPLNRHPANPQQHRRYASLPVDETPHQQFGQNRVSSKYDFIPDEQLQRHGSARYAYSPGQLQNSGTFVSPRSGPVTNHDERRVVQVHNHTGNAGRYAEIPGEQTFSKSQPQERDNNAWANGGRVYSRGRYARVPLQDDDPPALPERNGGSSISPRNNPATQKLHEILTTPRKVRSRSEERTLSPKRSHQPQNTSGTPHRRALTPGSSPSAGRTLSPGTRGTPQGTPQSRTFSPTRPQTSTPNKEPSARRCLPLTEVGAIRLPQDICPASNCGRLRYVETAPVDLTELVRCEPPPRYAYLESGPESVPMICSSPRYQVVPAVSESQKRSGYQSVESAFVARTAVVPPLSPPNSEANTTLASGVDKHERRNAPLLLILVGILTCGLSLYLSWTQGRRYYFDSAAGCGACCALAGACRSLKRTWTGLGLAALSALSCAGLLLMAVKAPRWGTPLHDVTAGALCGVSVLGATLALLALVAPRCDLTRHRRVHSWIPNFSP
ncbi:uncharacterized protein LOC107223609 isoform X1 [Neodiprion lecontei]|uniref:Uncharacterized protein LOC107223609 isoform X1 n=1 Tax=Neodiprion lecontei TaxID=441921 RepID=A0A6J0BWL7_NEOLC|nr:uncharacterized protein LOC107223609 isoform X1 [Neodiprion lecontei]